MHSAVINIALKILAINSFYWFWHESRIRARSLSSRIPTLTGSFALLQSLEHVPRSVDQFFTRLSQSCGSVVQPLIKVCTKLIHLIFLKSKGENQVPENCLLWSFTEVCRVNWCWTKLSNSVNFFNFLFGMIKPIALFEAGNNNINIPNESKLFEVE